MTGPTSFLVISSSTLFISIVHAIVWAESYIAAAKRGKSIEAGRFWVHLPPAFALGALSLPLADVLLTIVYQAHIIADAAVWFYSPPPPEMTPLELGLFFVVTFVFTVPWLWFLVTVHDGYLRWRVPEVEFEPMLQR